MQRLNRKSSKKIKRSKARELERKKGEPEVYFPNKLHACVGIFIETFLQQAVNELVVARVCLRNAFKMRFVGFVIAFTQL